MRKPLWAWVFFYSCQLWAVNFQSPIDFKESPKEIQVLLFLSSTCPCSMSHMDHIYELRHKYSKVQFWGVISDTTRDGGLADTVEAFFRDAFRYLPIIHDPKQELIRKYGALKTPHVVVIRRQGKEEHILAHGGVSDNRNFSQSQVRYLELNLEALSSAQSIPHPESRSFGCYIRRI
jgi:hypothetical protein